MARGWAGHSEGPLARRLVRVKTSALMQAHGLHRTLHLTLHVTYSLCNLPSDDDVSTRTEEQLVPPPPSKPALVFPSVKVRTTWFRSEPLFQFEPLGHGLRTLALLLLYLNSVFPTLLPVRWICTVLVVLILGLSAMLYHSIQPTRSVHSSACMGTMKGQLPLTQHDHHDPVKVPIRYSFYVHHSIPVLANGLQALALIALFIHQSHRLDSSMSWWSTMDGLGPEFRSDFLDQSDVVVSQLRSCLPIPWVTSPTNRFEIRSAGKMNVRASNAAPGIAWYWVRLCTLWPKEPR